MIATVHKVLIHVKQILEEQYFTSILERKLQNRGINFIAETHVRKKFKNPYIYNIFNRTLVLSDPVISSSNLQNRLRKRRVYVFAII